MDDEEDLDPDASIIGMSFGTPRDFLFRHHTLQHPNEPAKTKKPKFGLYKVTLPSGSLIQMKPPTNSFWFHELPAKATAGKNPRVSLTFRVMKMRGKDFVEEKRNKDYITKFLNRDPGSTARTSDISESSTTLPIPGGARQIQPRIKQQEGMSSRFPQPYNDNNSNQRDFFSHRPQPPPMAPTFSATSSRFTRPPSTDDRRTRSTAPKRNTQNSQRRTSSSQQRWEKQQHQE